MKQTYQDVKHAVVVLHSQSWVTLLGNEAIAQFSFDFPLLYVMEMC